MVTVPHTINGRFYGMFYFLDDGRSLYLAHRKMKEVFHMKNAWCIDMMTLKEAERRGVNVIGVLVGKGKSRKFWLTERRDFFDSPYSFDHYGDTRQRGLPTTMFRVNPLTSETHISKSVKIR